MTYLFQGLLLGFAYVMPIGTQNMFVINTALTQKKRRVIATALIVCFFDVTLAAACFFGVGAAISALKWLQLIILGVGSLVVIWIGIGLIRSSGTLDRNQDVSMPILSVIWKACVVTWFNPQAIIDGTMLLGAFRAALPGPSGMAFIIGVCMASFIWWMGMSSIVSLFADKISDKVLRVINIICGAIIVFYGLKLIWNFIGLTGIL
ncbi:MAG: LysE family transporter [Firmicutes bacterium]|nr:LysE family transporter [Bacillota bacterium]